MNADEDRKDSAFVRLPSLTWGTLPSVENGETYWGGNCVSFVIGRKGITLEYSPDPPGWRLGFMFVSLPWRTNATFGGDMG